MAFLFRKSQGPEVLENFLLAAAAITVDRVSYDLNTGYVTQATPADANCQNVVGVAAQTVDNSGGAAGDLSALQNITVDALYKVDGDATPVQTNMFTNVVLVTNTGTVDSDGAANDYTGLVHLLKIIDATNKKILARLNFYSPRA